MVQKNVLVIIVFLLVSLGGNAYLLTRTPVDTQIEKVNTVDTENLIIADTRAAQLGTAGIDPGHAGGGWDTTVNHQIYESLISFEGSDYLNPVGGLAQNWTISADGRSWTFFLRQGVLFTSGKELTSEDVIWSWQRTITINDPNMYHFKLLQITKDDIVVIDKYTVKVTLKEPLAENIVYQLFASHGTSILEKEATMKHEVNGDLGKAWVQSEHSEGTGPYKIESYADGSKIVIVWNPNHWRWHGETAIRDPPSIKKITWLCVKEPAEQLMMLKKGDIDIAVDLTPDMIADDIINIENFKLVPQAKLRVFQLRMNVRAEINNETNPLNDNRVRQAIKYAIDNKGIANQLYRGQAWELQSILPPTVEGYLDYQPYNLNLTKSKELLKEAGYPNGFDLNMYYTSWLPATLMAPKIISDLAKVGIRVIGTQMSGGELMPKLEKAQFEIQISGLGFDYPDPDAGVFSMAYSRTDTLMTDPNHVSTIAHMCGWANPEIADLIDKARRTINWEERQAIYNYIQKIWVDEGPIAQIGWAYYENMSTRTWVEGLNPNPLWAFEAYKMYKEPMVIS